MKAPKGSFIVFSKFFDWNVSGCCPRCVFGIPVWNQNMIFLISYLLVQPKTIKNPVAVWNEGKDCWWRCNQQNGRWVLDFFGIFAIFWSVETKDLKSKLFRGFPKIQKSHMSPILWQWSMLSIRGERRRICVRSFLFYQLLTSPGIFELRNVNTLAFSSNFVWEKLSTHRNNGRE